MGIRVCTYTTKITFIYNSLANILLSSQVKRMDITSVKDINVK